MYSKRVSYKLTYKVFKIFFMLEVLFLLFTQSWLNQMLLDCDVELITTFFLFASLNANELQYRKICSHSNENVLSQEQVKIYQRNSERFIGFCQCLQGEIQCQSKPQFFLDTLMGAIFNTIVFCLCPSGLDHSQEERSAQTPQGEQNTEKHTFYCCCFLIVLNVLHLVGLDNAH